MRLDGIGLFWEDEAVERRRTKKRRPLSMPAIPETGWNMPNSFPDLSSAKIISLDCETKDENLLTKGPGFVRGDAHVVGVSVGTDDGFRAYYPVRHEISNNLNPEAVFRWLNKELNRAMQPKIGHNIMYDLEALSFEGVTVSGNIYDTMFAETLIDEHRRSYSLDNVARKYLGDSKIDEELYKWSAKAYGGDPVRKQAGNIYRCPTKLVGPYAEGDVDLPLRIFEKQRKILEDNNTWELYKLECDLIPFLLSLRLRGVCVDVEKAEILKQRLENQIKDLQRETSTLCGFDVDIWAAESVSRAFDKLNVEYGRTKTGKPSFTKDFLAHNKHPISKLIEDQRKAQKFLGTFVQGYILDTAVKGRIHGQFHSLRSDMGGTVSGRFSSSHPNLQNIPSRDEELGPLVRSLFVPEEGMQWCCADYSQIEPRILMHYAEGEVADAMRAEYEKNPKIDFYTLVMNICDVNRRTSKTLSLGMMYGMGQQKLADSLDLSLGEAQPLFAKYHNKLPFLKEIQQATSQAANNRGWIKTILGRRAHFDLWEPRQWDRTTMPLPREQAMEKWDGKIRRAETHKALNRLIQGSAADIFKKAMVLCFKLGLFKDAPAHLMVHDEIDFSVPTEGNKHLPVIDIMEEAVPLRVPLIVDYKVANNWGDAK